MSTTVAFDASLVSESPQRRFSRAAWGVVAFCLGVILWGAYVRATGSGAGCGSHWPLCNGEVLPRSERIQTMIEFSHRASSGLSLIAVLGLAGFAFRVFPRGHLVRRLAALSGVAIVTEALVGAGLVLLKLVEHDQSVLRAISISIHLVNTSFLMGMLTLTAWASGRDQRQLRFADPVLRRRAWIFLASFIALGITGAVTALGDTLFQASSLAEGFRQDWASGSHFLQRLRVFHPFLAMTWGFLLIPFLLDLADRKPSLQGRVRWQSGLVLANLALGATNVTLLAPIPLQLAHLLMANLIWIGLVVLSAEAAT